MKFTKIAGSLLIVATALTLNACKDKEEKQSTEPTTTKPAVIKHKLGYSLGYIIGERLKSDFEDVDAPSITQGLSDIIHGNKPALSEDEMKTLIEAAKKKQMEDAHKKMKEEAKENLERANKFLDENGKKAGIHTTDSGLQYKNITKELTPEDTKELLSYIKDKPTSIGTEKLTDKSTVTVSYVGSYINKDGSEHVFDASSKRQKPVTFPLEHVIPGWREGVKLMHTGETFELFIPPALGYGEQGIPNVIPPNEMLKFKITLLSVKHEDEQKSTDENNNSKNEKKSADENNNSESENKNLKEDNSSSHSDKESSSNSDNTETKS
ncbi:MAG: FKBP-type peptidyl-prolyl cis-trans isomerase [Aestuariivita sp.]|nr:FKBP-type peptidyl-prolyl cis-trans isomerase [Aestuariivita sp.]